MRVAILAPFPVHVIPGFEAHAPRGHYATWLPQLSAAWEGVPDLELHWIAVSRTLDHPQPIHWRGQTFHILYVPEKMRPLRLYWRDCALIRRVLDRVQPDVVHAWGSEDCYGLGAARSERDFLLSMQGILTEYARRSPAPLLERLQARIERFILGRAHEITSESTWGCEMVRSLAPHAHIEQVEYGVPESFFALRWHPDPGNPAAIFVGTPTPRKGIQDAIDAFARPELAHAKLWILGDTGSQFARELHQRSTPNVCWLGRTSREETAAHLAKAWCLVLPTRADTSPNVVKEARVIGLPVVTTPHGGQRDYVIDGQTGFLVEPGDIERLSAKLNLLLGDLQLTQNLGATLHPEHRQWFRPENTAAKFLAIYKRLAKERD